MSSRRSVTVDRLQDIRNILADLRDALIGDIPDNVAKGEFFYEQVVISKTSTISLGAAAGVVNLAGFNAAYISTDGRMNTISYRIRSAAGNLSREIEAEHLPVIVGRVKGIEIANDTAESGLSIFVHRLLLPPLLLPFLAPYSPVRSRGELWNQNSGLWEFNYNHEEVTIFASAARTTTVNSSDLVNRNGVALVIYLNITAASGTTPTLDIEIQYRLIDDTTTYTSLATIAQQTGTGVRTLILGLGAVETQALTQLEVQGIAVPRNYRGRAVIGGTTPSFTFALTAVQVNG